LAESYGHLGIKVEKQADLKPALVEAFKQKERTVFLDILTDPLENVFPMIPSGAGHHEMLLAGRVFIYLSLRTQININLNQRQLSFNMFSGSQVSHLNHINQLIKLFYNLLNNTIVTHTNNGHS
jgi:hypothetical protein